ncbi:DHHC palmitoyltransferase-domain-containing protein [Phlyctochytrium arcticum]|nr:DHHC palmitoyltransferase-domain-containing protein [Phlyctochytrium arcticum]
MSQFIGLAIGIFSLGLVLISLPCVLFIYYVIPEFDGHQVAIIVPFVWIWAMTMASMCRTSLTDPGFLPQNIHPLDAPTSGGTPCQDASIPPTQTSSDNSTHRLPPGYPFDPSAGPPTNFTKLTTVGDSSLVQKYCITCNIWRPLRASHCSTCDRCVANHDHHCPWVANCVGKRNYSVFYMFISSCSALAMYLFIFSLLGLINSAKRDDLGAGEVIRQHPVNLVILLYCFFIGWSVVGMACYHSWISFNAMTTHEQLKQGVQADARRSSGPLLSHPFSRGSSLRNWLWVQCRSREPKCQQ